MAMPPGSRWVYRTLTEQLDAIAYELNIRPRQRFNYRCPIEVITDVVLSEQKMLGSIQ